MKPRFQGTVRMPKEDFKVDLYIEKKFTLKSCDVCDLWYKKKGKKKYLLRSKPYNVCCDKALDYIEDDLNIENQTRK